MTELSGKMHCWLMPTVKVDDERLVALRGVNFLNEYDSSRAHDQRGYPWWHVPTVKFDFDVKESPPGITQTLTSALALMREEWPVLAKGTIIDADQDLTGKWGLTNAAGEIEAVTRIMVNLGTKSHEPRIKLHPEHERLKFPRHPVVWVPVDGIQSALPSQIPWASPELAEPDSGRIHVVTDKVRMEMETQDGTTVRFAENLPLQGTVAGRFLKSFPGIFPEMPKADAASGLRALARPSLVDISTLRNS